MQGPRQDFKSPGAQGGVYFFHYIFIADLDELKTQSQYINPKSRGALDILIIQYLVNTTYLRTKIFKTRKINFTATHDACSGAT